jgi:hypothetical protein
MTTHEVASAGVDEDEEDLEAQLLMCPATTDIHPRASTTIS